jgi:hypothetical protein
MLNTIAIMPTQTGLTQGAVKLGDATISVDGTAFSDSIAGDVCISTGSSNSIIRFGTGPTQPSALVLDSTGLSVMGTKIVDGAGQVTIDASGVTSGTLAVVRGGTGTTESTGTGAVVRNLTPHLSNATLLGGTLSNFSVTAAQTSVTIDASRVTPATGTGSNVLSVTPTLSNATFQGITTVTSSDATQTSVLLQNQTNASNLYQLNVAGSSHAVLGSNGVGLYDASSNVNKYVAVWRGGNMGVGGKTAPAYSLDVLGDINCTGSLRINDTAVAATKAIPIMVHEYTRTWNNVLSSAFTLGTGTKYVTVNSSALSYSAPYHGFTIKFVNQTTSAIVTAGYEGTFPNTAYHYQQNPTRLLTNATLPAGSYKLCVSTTATTDLNDYLTVSVIEFP